jgi:UDP-N-acetylglucosamine 1-carboxyvinyltransferase
MYHAVIQGSHPLIGDVKISGSNDSAAAIIFASLFYSEPIVLENIPESTFTKRCFEILEALGVTVDHISGGRYRVHPELVNSFEIPYNEGKVLDVIFYSAGPLLFNFGKAIIPKPVSFSKKKIALYLEMWEEAGIEVFEDDRFVVLKTGEPKPVALKIESKDTVQTATAILSTVFIPGETFIFNPSSKFEVGDLVKLFNIDSQRITYDSEENLKISGGGIFKAETFSVQPSTTETVFFATTALLTRGNLTIKNLEREPFLSYLSVLSKMGCNFEFSKNDLKIWSSGEKPLVPLDVNTAPAPGFLNAWHGFVLLLLTQAKGDSSIVVNNPDFTFEYLTELKRMHVMTTLLNTNLDPDINTDQIKINVAGPTKLAGAKLSATDVHTGSYLLAAALCAEGDSELYGLEKIEYRYDNIFQKLINLGADLELQEE